MYLFVNGSDSLFFAETDVSGTNEKGGNNRIEVNWLAQAKTKRIFLFSSYFISFFKTILVVFSSRTIDIHHS
jgi:hypothetical protein